MSFWTTIGNILNPFAGAGRINDQENQISDQQQQINTLNGNIDAIVQTELNKRIAQLDAAQQAAFRAEDSAENAAHAQALQEEKNKQQQALVYVVLGLMGLFLVFLIIRKKLKK